MNTDPNWNEDEQEFFEERAAILEYEGGLPRPHAEAAARLRTVEYSNNRLK